MYLELREGNAFIILVGYYAQVRCLGYPESQTDEVEKNMIWIHYSDLKEIGYYTKNNVDSMPPFRKNHFTVAAVRGELMLRCTDDEELLFL